ncbi:unnamed protein product [Closterium sp. Yama58-4]|nr:unnamed protein product [Closterium sp. Yama58-4]
MYVAPKLQDGEVLAEEGAYGREPWAVAGLGWNSNGGGNGVAMRAALALPSHAVRRKFSFTHGARLTAGGVVAAQVVGGGQGGRAWGGGHRRDGGAGGVGGAKEEAAVAIDGLSEFGLALFAAPNNASMQVPLAGTFGYLAPEYLSHRAVSTRTDVFAFGVVLLELLSGQPPVDDTRPRGMQCLTQ